MKNFIKKNYDYIIIIFIIIIFNINTGYLIYRPGSTIDLNSRISSTLGYKSEGSLEMISIKVTKGTLPFYLYAKVNPYWELVPNKDLLINDDTTSDRKERDYILFNQSVENAKYAALQKAKIPFEISDDYARVLSKTKQVSDDISVGDALIKYDQTIFSEFEEFIKYIDTKNEDDSIELTLLNNKEKEYSVDTNIYKEEDDLYVGLVLGRTFRVINEDINFKEDKKEAGPSGGLMLGLSMYNSLVKEDITKGYKIAGTGTLSKDGDVGAIGGVKFKLNSAIKSKVDYLLLPAENKKDVLNTRNKSKIKVIYVSSFDDALKKLKEI